MNLEKNLEKKQKTKFHEFTAENDMKYRGPLNYQHFQILGWACIVAAVGAAVITLGGNVDPGVTAQFGGIGSVLSFIASLALPFLLTASFARLLNNAEGYKKLLLINGGAALAIFAASMLFGGRYFIGILQNIVVQREEVVPLLTELVRAVVPGGFVAFNMFIDLFLCTLTMFFLNARPKRVFTGKWVIILRLLVILPIGIEAYCLWLKIQAIKGLITLPLWSFPLLTVKPPIMVLLFIVMAFVVKIREYRYCRHGKTHEEYQAFMQTNRNAFHLSVRLCILMVVFAVIDFILAVVMMLVLAISAGELAEGMEITEEFVRKYLSLSLDAGIGKSCSIVLIAPIMLLFSYNAVPKKKIISLLAPVAAIVLSLIIVLEAGRMGIGMLMEGKKIDLYELAAMFAYMQ